MENIFSGRFGKFVYVTLAATACICILIINMRDIQVLQ